jgi:hypothetical protein
MLGHPEVALGHIRWATRMAPARNASAQREKISREELLDDGPARIVVHLCEVVPVASPTISSLTTLLAESKIAWSRRYQKLSVITEADTCR